MIFMKERRSHFAGEDVRIIKNCPLEKITSTLFWFLSFAAKVWPIITVLRKFQPFSRGKSAFLGSTCCLNRTTTSLALSVSAQKRRITMAAAEVPLMRKLLAGFVKPYFEKNPTAVTALELIHKEDAGPICYDHFAFRTFGVDGCGIDSIAQIFIDLGYKTRDELRFPAKKLRALWFSPPEHLYEVDGELENGPAPRIFISELLVDQLTEKSQSVIRKYTTAATQYNRHAATASVLNTLTWPTPSFADYQQLARESEYAAWTLVNGYSLNHATVSVHSLSQLCNISKLNQFLQSGGIKLNSEGGILKVSPDGGLQQSSSVADSVQYAFADGEVETVAGSYIEFAERLVLPAYSSLKLEEVRECHRREGFEVGNADKIFESTSSDQMGIQRR
ncbi:hypothetical protein R1flu_006729 [Riccia fluitans]|uniref:2-oxoadipate dioxygenase/decarboxylase n=1 Tax=Riccia fluitans TaxID=41844 RepID=A0ABD1YX67_9MARC